MSQDSVLSEEDLKSRKKQIKEKSKELLIFLRKEIDDSKRNEPSDKMPWELGDFRGACMGPMEGRSFQYDIQLIINIVKKPAQKKLKAMLKSILRKARCVQKGSGEECTEYVARKKATNEAHELLWELCLELRPNTWPKDTESEQRNSRKRKHQEEDVARKKRKPNPPAPESPEPKKKKKGAQLRHDLTSVYSRITEVMKPSRKEKKKEKKLKQKEDFTPQTKSESRMTGLRKKKKRRKKLKQSPSSVVTEAENDKEMKTPLSGEKRKKRSLTPPGLDSSMELHELPSKRYSDVSGLHSDGVPAGISESSHTNESEIPHPLSLSQPVVDVDPADTILSQSFNSGHNESDWEVSQNSNQNESDREASPCVMTDPPEDEKPSPPLSPKSSPTPKPRKKEPSNPYADSKVEEDDEEESTASEFDEDAVDHGLQKQQAAVHPFSKRDAKSKLGATKKKPKGSKSKFAMVDLTTSDAEAPPANNSESGDSEKKEKPKSDDDFQLPKLSIREALALKEGDQIDLKDNVGRWLPAEVVSRPSDRDVATFHYIGWGSNYDVELTLDEKFQDMAPLHSHSKGTTDRLPLKKGDRVDICHESKWYTADVKKLHWPRKSPAKEEAILKGETVSPQVQVKFLMEGKTKIQIRWFDRREPKEMAPHGAETKKRKISIAGASQSIFSQKRRPSGFSSSMDNYWGKPRGDKPEKKWSNPWKVGDDIEYKRGGYRWVPYQVVKVEGEEVTLRGAYNSVEVKNAKKDAHYLRKASDSGLDRARMRKQREKIKFEDSLRSKHKDWEVRRCDGDGNCLFRTIAWAVYGDQERHKETRHKSVLNMWEQRDFYGAFFWGEDECGNVALIDKLKRRIKPNGDIWGDHCDITSLAEVYNVRIEVWEWSSELEKAHLSCQNPNPNDPGIQPYLDKLPIIRVARQGQIHYDLIVDKKKGPSIKHEMVAEPKIITFIQQIRQKAMQEEHERDEKNRKEREAQERAKKEAERKENAAEEKDTKKEACEKPTTSCKLLASETDSSDDEAPLGDAAPKDAPKRSEPPNPLELTDSEAEEQEADDPEKEMRAETGESKSAAKEEDEKPKEKEMTPEEMTKWGIEQLMDAYKGKKSPKREVKQEATFSSSDEGKVSSWKCKHCTMQNTKMEALTCEVCGKERFHPEKNKWTCEHCTIVNDHKDAKCSVCGKKRKNMICPGCTFEYPIEKSHCPACRAKNVAHKRRSMIGGGFGLGSSFRRDDRRFTNVDYKFDEDEESDEYDPSVFASLIYNEEKQCYIDEKGNELQSNNDWLDWYDSHNNDYIIVVGDEESYLRYVKRNFRSGSSRFDGPALLNGKQRVLTIIAFGQLKSEEYALYKKLDKTKLKGVAKSFHWILKKASQLTKRNQEDKDNQKKIYLLEDPDGKVRYGLDPVTRRRAYFYTTGARRWSNATPQKKKMTCRNKLNEFFKVLKAGKMKHNDINTIATGGKVPIQKTGRGKKGTRKSKASKRKSENTPSGSVKKKQKRRLDRSSSVEKVEDSDLDAPEADDIVDDPFSFLEEVPY